MAEIAHFGVASPRRISDPPSAPLLELNDFGSYHAPIHGCPQALGRSGGRRNQESVVQLGEKRGEDLPQAREAIPPRAFLWDARQAADAIDEFTRGLNAESYRANPLVRSAVERQFRNYR